MENNEKENLTIKHALLLEIRSHIIVISELLNISMVLIFPQNDGEDDRVIVQDEIEIVDTCEDGCAGNDQYERKPVNELITFFERLAKM